MNTDYIPVVMHVDFHVLSQTFFPRPRSIIIYFLKTQVWLMKTKEARAKPAAALYRFRVYSAYTYYNEAHKVREL